jgi:hypothetical protein
LGVVVGFGGCVFFGVVLFWGCLFLLPAYLRLAAQAEKHKNNEGLMVLPYYMQKPCYLLAIML